MRRKAMSGVNVQVIRREKKSFYRRPKLQNLHQTYEAN